jgi:Kef-type K+ transport system membrane component KefB
MPLIHLPALPLQNAGWVFALLFAVMLVVPMLAERARIPRIAALVIAGTAIGPAVLGLVERQGAIALLGSAGLLYLMFLAGLELDLDEFVAHRRDAVLFGIATFIIPITISVLAVLALGFGLLPSILIASCWASHTLLTYPVFRRFGTQGNRAVAASVGATIVTDTAALLVLVVVVRADRGDLSPAFWATITVSLLVLVGLVMYALPALARWFFTGIGQDRSVRVMFVLTALFAASGLAELAGIEAIIGAFLAGLALNRLVPNRSHLMDRLEFLGSGLLIPLFLISVGMLIDPSIISDADTLKLAVAFTAMALGAKLLAAVVSGRLLGYDNVEIGAMFSLSGTQAAATLAAIVVGFEVGLVDTQTVNAVILVILASSLATSWVADRTAPRLRRPDRPQPIGDVVVVPVSRPESRAPLMRLAAAMARRDAGRVVPLTVASLDTGPSMLGQLQASTAESEAFALQAGADATGVVRIDETPSKGILHTLVEQGGSLIVLGWKGHTSRREALFGGIVDAVLAKVSVPMLIGRFDSAQWRSILLAISDDSATPAGRAGLQLALQTCSRVANQEDLSIRILGATTDEDMIRQAQVSLGLTDRDTTLETRRLAAAIKDHVRPGDLVVVPIRPDRVGLRRVATQVAQAIADNDLIIVYTAQRSAVDPEVELAEFNPDDEPS